MLSSLGPDDDRGCQGAILEGSRYHRSHLCNQNTLRGFQKGATSCLVLLGNQITKPMLYHRGGHTYCV